MPKYVKFINQPIFLEVIKSDLLNIPLILDTLTELHRLVDPETIDKIVRSFVHLPGQSNVCSTLSSLYSQTRSEDVALIMCILI